MATARPTLAAEHRDVTGKHVARLRRAGQLPAVVYGHGEDRATSPSTPTSSSCSASTAARTRCSTSRSTAGRRSRSWSTASRSIR